MKPLSIADYLDHFGGAPADQPRRESSPFRPRSLPSGQAGLRALNAASKPGGRTTRAMSPSTAAAHAEETGTSECQIVRVKHGRRYAGSGGRHNVRSRRNPSGRFSKHDESPSASPRIPR